MPFNFAWKLGKGGYERLKEESDDDVGLEKKLSNLVRAATGEEHSGKTQMPASEKQQPRKPKAQHDRETFTLRELTGSPRERVIKDCLVMADVYTNVIVEDEYTFLVSLAKFISWVYHRPIESIVVTVNHSTCMLFGGNWSPAYHMTVSAVKNLITADKNKYNTSLFQAFFDEELSCPADRGVIKFLGIEEENLATNGTTLKEEIERQNKSEMHRPQSFSVPRRAVTVKEKCPPLPLHQQVLSVKPSVPTPPDTPRGCSPSEKAEKILGIGRGRSKSLGMKDGSSPEVDMAATPLPAIPDKPAMDEKARELRKINKRMSLLHLFGTPGKGKQN